VIPVKVGHLKVAVSTPYLAKARILLLLSPNVLADHRLISSDGGYERSPSPEMLPYEVALPFPIDPSQAYGALPLMYPITCDTAYFGGIEIIICTWSGIR
jgi:hypothetical protein